MNKNNYNQIKNFLLSHNLIIALFILFLLMSILFRTTLLSRGVLLSFLHTSTILGILTLGQAIVILTGGIDLSNGALVGLTSILAAWIALSYGLPGIIFGSLVVATLIGCLSGLLITKFDFPPLVGTLVAMSVAQGLTLIITGGSPLALNNALLRSFGVSNILGVPYYSIIWIFLIVLFYYIASKTVFGRHVYAVGGSAISSFRCGVPTNRIKFKVYLLSAILAWLAGIIYVSYTTAGAPRAGGFHYMFDSISATIIGGISLYGGRGNVLDATLGVMFFSLLYMTVIFLNISPVLEGAFRGTLLLIVVIYGYLRERRVR